MTKVDLRTYLKAGHIMDDVFTFKSGQECDIYKADQFELGDEIIYIPDISLNQIHPDIPITYDEDIEEVVHCCYTGNDFLAQCNGNREKAERLFWYCNWQHPSSAYDEGAFEDDEEVEESTISGVDCAQVETPLGVIIARSSNDPDHLGIWINLHRPDADSDLPLALIEFSKDKRDISKETGRIITRVWGDGTQEDYTNRVIHKGIAEYFRQEDVVSSAPAVNARRLQSSPKPTYIVLCSPTQALGMKADLGNGPTTENGDRSSQYFTIAKGRKHLDRTVSVALIENINGLSKDEGYYTFHLIDNVSGCPCELYHTSDLSEDSLMTTLKEILDNLEKETIRK